MKHTFRTLVQSLALLILATSVAAQVTQNPSHIRAKAETNTFILEEIHLAATVSSETRKVRVGAWSLKIPRRMQKVQQSGMSFYATEFADHHTLIIDLEVATSIPWDKSDKRAGTVRKNELLKNYLEYVVKEEKRSRATGSSRRFSNRRVDRVSGGILPNRGACGALRWSAKDKGVPGLPGKVSTLRGFEVACLDYVDGADEFDLVIVGISERFCSSIGHDPIQDWEAFAARIFSSMKYEKGPGHKISDAGASGKPVVLDKLAWLFENYDRPIISHFGSEACL